MNADMNDYHNYYVNKTFDDSKFKYRIEFRDNRGWYCPGFPWCSPSAALVKEWIEAISKGDKDARIIVEAL